MKYVLAYTILWQEYTKICEGTPASKAKERPRVARRLLAATGYGSVAHWMRMIDEFCQDADAGKLFRGHSPKRFKKKKEKRSPIKKRRIGWSS